MTLVETGMFGLKDSQKYPAEPCKGCQEDSQQWGRKSQAWETEDRAWHPGTDPGKARGLVAAHGPLIPISARWGLCVNQALLPNRLPQRPAVTECARPQVEKDLLHWAPGAPREM